MNTRKAFIFSFDALLAVMIFRLVLASFTVSMKKMPISTNVSSNVSDAFRMLESNGYLQEEIDANSLTVSAENIHNKVLAYLPSNRGLRTEVKQYSLDELNCRLAGDFNGCFPQEERLQATFGDAVPTDKDIVRGRSIVIMKQQPGDCNIEYVVFEGSPDAPYWKEPYINDTILFSGPTIYFEEQDPEEIGLIVDVNTTPETELRCDENLTVNLTIEIEESLRDVVDVMLVIDRSGSMDDCAVVDGNVVYSGSGDLGGGTQICNHPWGAIGCILFGGWEYTGWVNVGEINISDTNAFDILLEWNGGTSENVKLYVEAPDSSKYGYTYGEPPNGCENEYDNKIYLAIPASLSQNGTWTAYAWNEDPSVSYTAQIREIAGIKSLIEVAQEAASMFVDDANWSGNDQVGLVSFASESTLDHILSSDKESVKSSIAGLDERTGNSTAIGEGIYTANDELLPPATGHGREDAMRFEIVLSDGQTNSGRDSTGAANEALANDTIIYTIGIGYDVAETELQNIADITGGEYYYASDENMLKYIYDLITAHIDHISSASSQVIVPAPLGAIVIDPGEGAISDTNIVYDLAGLEPGSVWYGSYTINFPCGNENNCERHEKVVPGEGAMLKYEDYSGNPFEVPFDANVILRFLTRDLLVDIFAGELLGKDDLYLDINVSNIGDLNTGETDIRFRLDDVNGTLLDSFNIPALCGSDENCTDNYRVYRNVNIKEEGAIYAIINEDLDLSECPLRNYDAINCYGGPLTQFFAIDYYVWVEA